MKKALAATGVLLLVSIAACSWCAWEITRPRGRELANIDIGGNRTVRIWSEEDLGEWGVTCIYYEILENGQVIVPPLFMGSDRGQRFEFQAAFADSGRLACIWQTNREAKGFPWIIIYDNNTRESWPKIRWCEKKGQPGDWEARYRVLQAENACLKDRPWGEQ